MIPDPSFNEARPNWAGKSGSAGTGMGPRPLASMRPGPIGPGNSVPLKVYRFETCLLQ